jgi:hypothetical protein
MSAVRGRVYASGTVALSGRVVRCARGYKAQYARIQSPLVLEADCQGSNNLVVCPNDVTRIDLPSGPFRSFYGWCGQGDHRSEDEDGGSTVDAGVWMRAAVKDLSGRYGVEVISWKE